MNFIKKYAFWIAAAMALIACTYAYCQFLLPLDVFLWDESHHGFYSMQIYNDLKAGDWGLFWAHTNHQALWMPLHSWVSGAFLYLFGFSYVSARCSSLFLFFWCALFLFLIGQELSKDKGWIIGLISTGLLLTSPILLSLATMHMQEMLGVFILLVLVYWMIKYAALEAVWKYLVVGFFLSVAYWAKTNFALQMIFGVGLFQLSLLWGINKSAFPKVIEKEGKTAKKALKQKVKENKPRNLFANLMGNKLIAWCINNLLIIAGFLPLFILWWATPPFDRKYALGFIFRTQGIGEALFYPSVNILGRVVFYLQSMVSSYNFSFWLGLGGLAAAGASFCYFRDKNIRLLLLMFLSNLIMVSMVGNIQERYLSAAAPLVFILLAYFMVILVDKLKNYSRFKIIAYVLTIFLTSAIVYDALNLTRYTRETANRSILFFIYKDSLNQFTPPFLFGLVKRPPVTYPMDQVKKYSHFPSKPVSRIEGIMDYFRDNIDRNKSIASIISYHDISPYDIYWSFHDWAAPIMTANDLSYAGKYFWLADYFIDIEASPNSPYYINWLDKGWKEKYGPVLLKSGYIELLSRKEFADLGLTACIYKRVKSPYD